MEGQREVFSSPSLPASVMSDLVKPAKEIGLTIKRVLRCVGKALKKLTQSCQERCLAGAILTDEKRYWANLNRLGRAEASEITKLNPEHCFFRLP
jgi:hypothetical protein